MKELFDSQLENSIIKYSLHSENLEQLCFAIIIKIQPFGLFSFLIDNHNKQKSEITQQKYIML